jgi:putative pyruvate formate lyase activating enzyme
LVYNTNGYERLEVLHLLDGIVDIYLPDAKYGQDALAQQLSATPGYLEVNRSALREMWRQVGPLQLNAAGIAQGGLVVRHLVLPGQLYDTVEILRWLSTQIGPQVWISLMTQYYPAHRISTGGCPQDIIQRLNRRLTRRECDKGLALLQTLGLENGWVQERGKTNRFCPDFQRCDPFANSRELPAPASSSSSSVKNHEKATSVCS